METIIFICDECPEDQGISGTEQAGEHGHLCPTHRAVLNGVPATAVALYQAAVAAYSEVWGRWRSHTTSSAYYSEPGPGMAWIDAHAENPDMIAQAGQWPQWQEGQRLYQATMAAQKPLHAVEYWICQQFLQGSKTLLYLWKDEQA